MRILAVMGCWLLLPALSLAWADDLEDTLEDTWNGAAVVVRVDLRSDCGGTFTDNDIKHGRVSSSGEHRFVAGEIGRVSDTALHRRSFDLEIELEEPLLAPYTEGPFTLYRELRCKVELQIELPDEVRESERMEAVEAFLAPSVTRHRGHSEAAADRGANGRRRIPYPEDYADTVAHLAEWKVDNLRRQAARTLGEAGRVVRAVTERVRSDPELLRGLAEGLHAGRYSSDPSCETLIATSVGISTSFSSESPFAEGKRYGQALMSAAEVLGRLPECHFDPEEIRLQYLPRELP
ncbi:MAG: hypothetical protein HYV63_16970 [Candidatus Schekmanbacteria bacterium]|nr:hypothetical protein [Candidatus Schekmanbacteria bacterium]